MTPNHVLQPRRPGLVVPLSARLPSPRPPGPGPFDTASLIVQPTLRRIDPARVEIVFDEGRQEYLLGQPGLGCLAVVPAHRLTRLPTWQSPQAVLGAILADAIRAECWAFASISFDTEQVRRFAAVAEG